jgi:hypothetical protein
MPQGLWSPVASALQPLAARSFADAHGLGDLALGPAFFLEEPGLQPAGFFPVVERRVQAWPSIADHPETLVFNVPLSKSRSRTLRSARVGDAWPSGAGDGGRPAEFCRKFRF